MTEIGFKAYLLVMCGCSTVFRHKDSTGVQNIILRREVCEILLFDTEKFGVSEKPGLYPVGRDLSASIN